MEAKQTWCALCQWPGRKPFMVGTFMTDARDTQQVAREKAIAEWRSTMGDILPENVPTPELIRLIPGAIIFHPRDET